MAIVSLRISSLTRWNVDRGIAGEAIRALVSTARRHPMPVGRWWTAAISTLLACRLVSASKLSIQRMRQKSSGITLTIMHAAA
jgi:cobalamin biosynthesis protein CobD/CbiB